MFTIHIESAELTEKIQMIQRAVSEEGFTRMMQRTFNEVGKHAKKEIWMGVKQDYVVKRDFVYAGIQNSKISVGGGDVTCIIPLAGRKGSIGTTYKASGGAYGWNIRRKYRVRAKIVKTNTSVLPKKMVTYGAGEPPFRNLASSSIAFARVGKNRLPIKKIVGLALPQMPLNRSEDAVADGILNYAMKRLDHHFARAMKG